MSNELIDLVLADTEDRMQKAVDRAREDFATIRTGRPNQSLVDRIPVDYYGSEVALREIASFSVPEPQMMVISPFDKGAIEAIERAIQLADLGLSPSNDGHVMRLVFPPLNEERRRDLVKVVRGMAEDGRIAIRNIRRAGHKDIDALEKDGDVSSDDAKRASEAIDAMTRQHEDEINAALAAKEEELLEV